MTYLDVSVVAANFNNAAFLVDYFESWLSSTAQPMEHIFIDDGSTDESLAIARSYESKLPNLVILAFKNNQGFAHALNAGIERANGKYIMRIDPDDMVLPERLAQQYAALEHGTVQVVGGNARIFNSATGREIGTTNFPATHQDIERAILRGEHGVLHPTVMAQSHLFKSHRYIQEHVPAEDYDIFARMLRSGAIFGNITSPLIRYRVHQRSASNILPYSTIDKTYRIRDEVFGTHTPRLKVVAYFLHIKYYRKWMFEPNTVLRTIYLCVASLLRPDKAVKRAARALSIAASRMANSAGKS